ncbi:MAG TPA: single-stranded-DNA-specific exonuclease RecJ [Candidatus Levybacteria bacterium]|nr:single-stranded-DNA-specific exonuclease RecJ [Candidatus Levybacteria bacterium]
MKRWDILHSPDNKKNSSLNLDVQTIIAILLKNRGLDTKEVIEQFLHPHISDITLKKLGVSEAASKKALSLIEKTKEAEKTIIIYGDYDVDGVCASAILWETLYDSYKKVIPYIPDRVEEGYGLSITGIDNVLKKYPDVQLIITVDNGIAALDAIKYAKEKGIAVIVTDHHMKGKKLPDADVIIHTTKVCGAGVSYALSREISNQRKVDNDRHLELVALATVADCMPLQAENRALVKYGLEALSKTERAGLLEIFEEAKIDKNVLDVYHIGFIIAPRLNAAGRLASAMDSLRLICTVDTMRAKLLAKKLGGTNSDRQTLTTDLFNHAKSNYANGDLKKIIVAADSEYNQGVIGLIASKLTESYYRPSIVISVGSNGVSKGSARSVKGVNIVDVLRSVSDHLVQVGGHEMAAGFTIKTENIETFKTALYEKSEEYISDEHLMRVMTADMQLPISLINHEIYTAIQQFAPFGQSNAEPAFVAKSVLIKDIRMLGKEGKHVKFLLEEKGTFIEAIAFGFGINFDGKVGDTIDILYTVSLDTWNGRSKLVLRIKDLH